MMSAETIRTQYQTRYEACLPELAVRLEELLEDHLRGIPRIDRISARAKDPDSFTRKALREDGGKRRYEDPLVEIQDQIGARVSVLYLADVETVHSRVLDFFTHIEARSMRPESEWEFGYFGVHLMLRLPADAVRSDLPREHAPDFFELQIKTLFQHAWSEANHDLGYKPSEPLTAEQQRWLAFAASQAWGADQAFNSLIQQTRTDQ